MAVKIPFSYYGKGAGFQFVKEGTFAHYNNDYEQAMLILKKVIKI